MTVVAQRQESGEPERFAEASAGVDVSCLTWLTSDKLLVGSSSNSELQIWQLDPSSGVEPDSNHTHKMHLAAQLVLPRISLGCHISLAQTSGNRWVHKT